MDTAFIKKTRRGCAMGMAYFVLSYTKYRHGSFAQGFIVHRFTQIRSRWLGLLITDE